jgi:hypothetical protein
MRPLKLNDPDIRTKHDSGTDKVSSLSRNNAIIEMNV